MLYQPVFDHKLKRLLRRKPGRFRLIATAGLTALLLYVVWALASLGFVFDEVVSSFLPGVDPGALFSGGFISVWLSLLLLRLFTQRSAQMRVRPYQLLPLARRNLAFFFHVDALLSVHNLLPVVFLVPYWVRHAIVAPVGMPLSPLWLPGMILLVLLAHFAAVGLQFLLGGSLKQFVVAAAVFLGLVFLDAGLGTGTLRLLSSALVDALAAGSPLVLAATLLVTALVTGWVFRLSKGGLYEAVPDKSGDDTRAGLSFDAGRGAVAELMLLEWKLMGRNRRPRTLLLSALIMGGAYLGLLLTYHNQFSGVVGAAILGVLSSSLAALNYGQLMFSWESSYFNGVMSRAHRPDEIIKAKLFMLQGLTLAAFVLALPLVLALAPEELPLHVAFLFYNAGITSILILALALLNSRRVDLTKGGSLLNYEGFSIAHFLWFVPMILPPVLLLKPAAGVPHLGLYIVAAAGIAGLAGTPLVVRAFSAILGRRKYIMISGFAQYGN